MLSGVALRIGGEKPPSQIPEALLFWIRATRGRTILTRTGGASGQLQASHPDVAAAEMKYDAFTGALEHWQIPMPCQQRFSVIEMEQVVRLAQMEKRERLPNLAPRRPEPIEIEHDIL